MVIVRIRKIIWAEGIEDHIQKHKISVKEAEQVINADSHILEGHTGRKILVNRVGTRIVSVIVLIVGNKLYVVTARDADSRERKEFYEFEKLKTKKV